MSFVSFLFGALLALGVGATRQLSVDSLELEMMKLEALAESHHTEEIHQILGHHHDEQTNRDEILESVLETGVFPKSKRPQDQTTDELVKDYLDKGLIYPKGRRKYGFISSPSTVSQSDSKEEKNKKNFSTESGSAEVATTSPVENQGNMTVPPSDGISLNSNSLLNQTNIPSDLSNATVHVVAQSIPVSAFIYESSSTLTLTEDELTLMSTLTTAVLGDIFADFFDNPNIEFLSAETSAFESLGQNLFRFDATALFNGELTIPSEEELQDVVDHAFAPGATATVLYVESLHSSGDPKLAGVEGMLFIGSEGEIEALAAAAEQQETKGNVKVVVPTLNQTTDSEVETVTSIDLVFLRTVLVISMVLFTIFLVYMEARRQNALLGLMTDENIMKPRTEKNEPTYRTDLFSKGVRRKDIESYDEVSIGDESYSMTSDASASPPSSPFRSELYTALRRQQEGSPIKPAWATRNRAPSNAAKPNTAEYSEVRGTASALSGGAIAGENADIVVMESSSEEHSTGEEEHILSIPMLETPKEYIVDNQDLASSTEYSLPGKESTGCDQAEGVDCSTSISSPDSDQEEPDKEESKSSEGSQDSNESAVAETVGDLAEQSEEEKQAKASGASASETCSSSNPDRSAVPSGQPTVNDVPSPEESPEPEWMKKFKKMGLDAP